jgi:hypothetical protein
MEDETGFGLGMVPRLEMAGLASALVSALGSVAGTALRAVVFLALNKRSVLAE